MAMSRDSKIMKDEGYDKYFDMVQSRKRLPCTLQETLTASFAQIPVASFPKVPGGKGDTSYNKSFFSIVWIYVVSDLMNSPCCMVAVIEILADMSIGDAVRILSETNILSAPVVDPAANDSKDWRKRYLGIVDYSAIVLWVLQTAEIAAITMSATSAAAAGVGTGAAGAIGALALGATGPLAVAGLTIAAVGAAVAGGVAADRGMGKDAPTAVDKLGEDFYKVILHEEPFKSTTVLIL